GYRPGPDWAHGMYHGPLVVQGLRFDMSDPAVFATMQGLNETLCRFELSTGEVGYGMHENACAGIYRPYGFDTPDAVARYRGSAGVHPALHVGVDDAPGDAPAPVGAAPPGVLVADERDAQARRHRARGAVRGEGRRLGDGGVAARAHARLHAEERRGGGEAQDARAQEAQVALDVAHAGRAVVEARAGREAVGDPLPVVAAERLEVGRELGA